MAAPAFSQIDFITGDRSWERAYFTTYALSLTFFESYLLPHLRKAGCERVTVFVDADGYRASLMELKSRAIGQEYSLIPIRSSTGIFHPKISYLWGGEGDLLLVGSGNLTFGGHGRNIEVLEALKPDTDSAAFMDLSEFLEQLITSDTLTIADTSELSELARRARNQVGTLDLAGPTRLIHSLQVPVLDQLADRAASVGRWKELICLSPYHHHAGEPVRELAERLGVNALQIGVPPLQKNASAFPFDKSRSWGLKIKTIAPRVDKPQRPLHAKWFELRGAECWTLTGSVNATLQSLATTKNVEVSVLRVLEGNASENWKSAKEPKHEPSDYSVVGEGQYLVLHAVLSADGLINGQVLGGEALAGLCTIWLRISDDHSSRHEVEVLQDGRFSWRPPDFNEFEASNSAQITLTNGELTARGWLSFQSILKLPSRSRAAQAAIARMLARDESLDDCRVLLDYIAFHSNNLLRSPSSSSNKKTKSVDNETVDEVFSVADLSLSGNMEPIRLLRDLAEEASERNRSWKMLSLIARLLVGRSLVTAGTTTKSGDRQARPEQEDEETISESESTVQALTLFNNQLYQEFRKAKEANRNLVPLLVVWLNVNLDMRLRHLGDPSGAYAFADQWMRRAINAPIPGDIREALDESVYGVGAALSLQTENLRTGTEEVFDEGLAPQMIHQWLESYLGDDVDPNEACKKADAWFETSTSALLIDGQSDRAIQALERILRMPTPRIYLSRILAAHSRGEAAELPAHAFRTRELELLKVLLRAPPERPRHRVIAKDRTGCPKCYVQLLKDVQTTLRVRRVAQCIQCKTILILLDP